MRNAECFEAKFFLRRSRRARFSSAWFSFASRDFAAANTAGLFSHHCLHTANSKPHTPNILSNPSGVAPNLRPAAGTRPHRHPSPRPSWEGGKIYQDPRGLGGWARGRCKASGGSGKACMTHVFHTLPHQHPSLLRSVAGGSGLQGRILGRVRYRVRGWSRSASMRDGFPLLPPRRLSLPSSLEEGRKPRGLGSVRDRCRARGWNGNACMRVG